jgi:hypothetical protein
MVTGRVIEKGTKEAIPFASVAFKGTTVGTTTDFEGNFKIHTAKQVDSLVASFMGYKSVVVKIKPHTTQHITIQLEENVQLMNEAVIRVKVNPALRIVNQAVANRKINDFSLLKSYEYDCYNKTDVSMNNISDKLKKNKLLQPLKQLFDTTNQMKNEDGISILPIFISETKSKYYYHANPSKTKEVLMANNIMGFGINEGSYIVDMLGTSLLQFNFNENWMRFLGKDFISPISSNCHNYYYYTLRDSIDIDGIKCYEIKLQLKRESDLGFLGTIWIADSTFAIRRILVEISPNANLNFIARLKIQQEQLPTITGHWIPTKTRAIVELSRFTENTSGFVAKMYRANSNIIVNQPKPDNFFDVAVERQNEDITKDTNYWNNNRPEKYTATEQHMYKMIDSVKNLPIVHTYTEIIQLITEGYYRTPKVDFGPYGFLLNYNQVEGFRTRIGFKTNQFFSRNWYYRGYVAYGFDDKQWKYGLGVETILSHKKWSTIGIHYKNDNDILGVTDPSSAPMINFGAGNNPVFGALNMASPLTRINRTVDYRLVYLKQLNRDFTIRLSAQNTYFKPLGNFKFAYLIDENKPASNGNISETFTYTAATVDLRFAYKEVLMSKGNNRIRVKLAKAPVATLSYTRGFKGIANGNFNFDKIQLNLNQHITTGILGNADFSITAGKIFGRLPYPILEVMRGNTTIIGADNNFNLMNLYEFVADEYAHFWYVQHFEGLFFNRIPLLKKLKLRNYAVIKGAYGIINEANKNMLPTTNTYGVNYLPINEFKSNIPYAEVGYGVENLFRFVTLGMVHRLTYLNNPDVRKWGINLGLVFKF